MRIPIPQLWANVCTWDIHSSFIYVQVVYILDQLRALENEMIRRIEKQGLSITPRILVVCQVTLLITVMLTDVRLKWYLT